MNNTNQITEHRNLIRQHIRSLNDAELEALTAHADFYQRQLDIRNETGPVLVHAALLSLCRRKQSPRPEDLASPQAFKFYLKRVIRSHIDSVHQPGGNPEPAELQLRALTDHSITRSERKEFRRRLRHACRQLVEAIQAGPAIPEMRMTAEI